MPSTPLRGLRGSALETTKPQTRHQRPKRGSRVRSRRTMHAVDILTWTTGLDLFRAPYTLVSYRALVKGAARGEPSSLHPYSESTRPKCGTLRALLPPTTRPPSGCACPRRTPLPPTHTHKKHTFFKNTWHESRLPLNCHFDS